MHAHINRQKAPEVLLQLDRLTKTSLLGHLCFVSFGVSLSIDGQSCTRTLLPCASAEPKDPFQASLLDYLYIHIYIYVCNILLRYIRIHIILLHTFAFSLSLCFDFSVLKSECYDWKILSNSILPQNHVAFVK